VISAGKNGEESRREGSACASDSGRADMELRNAGSAAAATETATEAGLQAAPQAGCADASLGSRRLDAECTSTDIGAEGPSGGDGVAANAWASCEELDLGNVFKMVHLRSRLCAFKSPRVLQLRIAAPSNSGDELARQLTLATPPSASEIPTSAVNAAAHATDTASTNNTNSATHSATDNSTGPAASDDLLAAPETLRVHLRNLTADLSPPVRAHVICALCDELGRLAAVLERGSFFQFSGSQLLLVFEGDSKASSRDGEHAHAGADRAHTHTHAHAQGHAHAQEPAREQAHALLPGPATTDERLQSRQDTQLASDECADAGALARTAAFRSAGADPAIAAQAGECACADSSARGAACAASAAQTSTPADVPARAAESSAAHACAAAQDEGGAASACDARQTAVLLTQLEMPSMTSSPAFDAGYLRTVQRLQHAFADFFRDELSAELHAPDTITG